VRPLEGVKVVELAEFAFVPACSALLGEWGAEVVKVERPGGDPFRSMRSGIVDASGGVNSTWEQFNRNKRSVTIDLSHPRGREALEPLVRWADVFVTSYRPRARRKLRVEPEDLFALQPRLVYARGHGQGQRGPDAEAGGFDAVSYWHRAGVCHVLTPQGQPPLNQRGGLGDAPSGLALAGGVAAALFAAQRSGRGVVVDVSLMSFGMWQISVDLTATSAYGAPPHLDTGRVPNPLIGEYRTSDGRTLMFVMLDLQRYWAPTCRALDCADLAEHPDYASHAQKAAAADAVRARFRQIIASQPLEHWEKRLREHGCVFSRTATPQEVLADPQARANGYVLQHPERPLELISGPVQFDSEPPRVRRPAPARAGQHTDEVLREAGLTPQALAALRAAAAIA
jgi:crotonobetainyl-CoA:carnitine CoA-transferase CaiB-like acyl-CoA transferase